MEQAKRYSLKILLLTVFIIAILSGSIMYAVAVSTPPITAVIDSSVGVGAYSYTVFKEGSTYYTKSGTTGAIAYSGTNATTVITSTISAVNSNGGGDIFIKSGNYPITRQVTLLSNVNIEGNGKATRLYLPDNQPEDPQHYCIFRGDDVSNSTVSNMLFDGNRANNTWSGVSIHGAFVLTGNFHGVNLENLDITEFINFGVFIIAYENETIYDVNVRGCRFFNGGMWNPITYSAYEEGAVITGCSIEQNDISGFSDIGINLQTVSTGIIKNCLVTNNKVHDGVNGYGSGEGTDAIYGSRFEGLIYNCTFSNNIITGVKQAIASGPDNYGNLYLGNMMSTDFGVTAAGALQLEGICSVAIGNVIQGGYAGYSSGIEVETTAVNTTLCNNIIINAGNTPTFHGLAVRAGAVNTVIMGTRFIHCTIDDIYDSGTNTKNRDNIGSNGNWITDV